MSEPSKPVQKSVEIDLPDEDRQPEPVEDTGSDVESPRPVPWILRRSDQTVVAAALGVAVLSMGIWCVVHWGRGGRLMEFERVAAESEPTAFRLDLNQAEWPELSTLPGIGDQMARDIVAYREENGRFRLVEDLMAIDGIGPKTAEGIAPFFLPIEQIGLDGAGEGRLTSEMGSKTDPTTVPPPREATDVNSGRVDLNRATLAQLEGAPGIGPVLAERIVESRERSGPFQRLEDVMRVSGIGEKTLEGFGTYFFVEPADREDSVSP